MDPVLVGRQPAGDRQLQRSGVRQLDPLLDRSLAERLLALNPGPPDRPVVPPALIADIAGGTFPAVMNVRSGRMIVRKGSICLAGFQVSRPS